MEVWNPPIQCNTRTRLETVMEEEEEERVSLGGGKAKVIESDKLPFLDVVLMWNEKG